MNSSGYLEIVEKEFGISSTLFLQRLYFAEWFGHGLSISQIEVEFKCIPWLSSPGRRTLYAWKKNWIEKRFHIRDGRAGREVPNYEITNRVSQAFDNSVNKTAREVARMTGLSLKTVCRHLRKMGLTYGQFQKVPYCLNEKKMKTRVEYAKRMLEVISTEEVTGFTNVITLDETPITFENAARAGWMMVGQPKPRVAAPTLHKRNFELTLVWGPMGLIHIDGCPQGQTIDGEYFRETILKKIEEWCEIYRPGQGVSSFYLHMDNAPAHNCRIAKAFMESHRFRRIEQPPYSPDLAP